MQNLEALYVVQFGDVAGPSFKNGGVAVLETNRIFGGDSGYFYLGTFSVSDSKITATITVTKHDPAWRDAFGDTATQFKVELHGQVVGNTISGQMKRLDKPGFPSLPVRLTRKAELP